MIKVRQNTYLERESTGTRTDRKIIETWLNPEFIIAVESLSEFELEWTNGSDYIVYLSSGLEIRCVGNPKELIDSIKQPVMLYSKN